MKKNTLLLLAGLIALLGTPVHAELIELGADRDTTIDFELPTYGSGGQVTLNTGNNGVNRADRSLLFFDLGGIPAGSTINSASLTLHLNKAAPGPSPVDVSLHPATSNWGAGTEAKPGCTTSGGVSNCGVGGGPAQAGSATWNDAFFGATAWGTPGGDFLGAASATASVGAVPGLVSWSSATLVANIQDWLDGTTDNFGWFLIGDESTSSTSRLFASSESAEPLNRPQLTIDYTPPLSTIIGQKIHDMDGDGDRDPGEPGLEGWQIELKTSGGLLVATASTNVDGFYFFDVFPGDYVVSEVLQTGWMATNPVGGSHAVTISAGQNVEGLDFLNKMIVDPTAVPAPAAVVLMVLGLAAGIRIIRKFAA